MKKYILFLLSISLLFAACEEENLNNIAANQFVVEAFIFAGEPIDDIRIKSTFPLADEEDTSSPINDATVTIIKDGQRFPLISSGDEGLARVVKNRIIDQLVEEDEKVPLEVKGMTRI